MKKGYTLIDVLIVVVVLGVLATIAIPAYRMIIRRAELKEVKNTVELARAGAKYYDLKHGISGLTTPGSLSTLKVDVPDDSECTYTIVDGGGGIRRLEVRRKSDNVLLYDYDLPDGPGSIKSTSDARYLQDLPT